MAKTDDWGRIPWEELEARASRLEASVARGAQLPEDVREALGYWRSSRVGQQRAAADLLRLASARGIAT